MKFGITCTVDSRIVMPTGATVEHNGKSFIFYLNDEHVLHRLRIISPVDNPDLYYFYKSGDAENSTTKVGYEPHIERALVDELKELESVLALGGNLKRVNWQKATLEFYPETEAEHARIQVVPSWFFLYKYHNDDFTQMTPKHLEIVVKDKDYLSELIVPMSFFREGMNDYRLGRNIKAFQNFYYVLEGLYSNGQTKQNKVTIEFAKSSELVTAAKKFIEDTDKDKNKQLKSQLLEALKTKDQPYTVEGFIKLIVKTRGDLHHFVINSTKKQATPFNDSDYAAVTFAAYFLASNCLVQRVAVLAK